MTYLLYWLGNTDKLIFPDHATLGHKIPTMLGQIHIMYAMHGGIYTIGNMIVL